MHITHLLTDLFKLPGLALAAPAVKAPTDNAREFPNVRLCNGLRGQGHCVEVDAHFKCQQLASPIRFNVKSLVQSQGYICMYSQGKRCDNTAFTVDSGKGTQIADVKAKWSRVLTGVVCVPYPRTEAGANDFVVADSFVADGEN